MLLRIAIYIDTSTPLRQLQVVSIAYPLSKLGEGEE
jgi:hypothetical protein